MALCACGGNPVEVPDVPDATPADSSCDCVQPRIAELVTRGSFEYSLDPNNQVDFVDYCLDRGVLIGGSCEYPRLDPRMILTYTGDRPDPTTTEPWTCGWYNRTEEWQDLATRSVCLAPAMPPATGSDGCECPTIQPLTERIERVWHTEAVSAGLELDRTAQCPEGAVLLGGGCSFTSAVVTYPITVSRSGVPSADEEAWRCTWRHAGTGDAEITLTTAICLNPPAYGLDPLEGRIVRVTKISSILAEAYGTFTASCAPDDFLLTGSCMVDGHPPNGPKMTMYYHGFDAPNAWRCAWRNPTTDTIPATATAICLTP
jgi:hypothetical protein